MSITRWRLLEDNDIVQAGDIWIPGSADPNEMQHEETCIETMLFAGGADIGETAKTASDKVSVTWNVWRCIGLGEQPPTTPASNGERKIELEL